MSSKSKNAEKNAGNSCVNLLEELIPAAAATSVDEDRAEMRYPFFRPVSIEMDGHNFSGFTREISPNGMGLLHSMEIPPRTVTVKFADFAQGIHLNVERCESIGEGWFISGGSVVGENS